MGKKVQQYVYVNDPETGATVILAPGDEVPAGVEVGDHVYEAAEDSVEVPAPTPPPSQVVDPGEAKNDEVQDDLTNLSHAELDELGEKLGIGLSGTRAEKQEAIRAAR